MIPPILTPADLQDPIGFLDSLLDTGPPSPDTIAVDVAPLTDADIEALNAGAHAFLTRPARHPLLQAMLDDIGALARFARAHCRRHTASTLEALPARLTARAFLDADWACLLVEGRPDLRALVREIADERIPLDRRRLALENLADGLAFCGVRIAEELRNARTHLQGFGSGLPAEFARLFEQSRQAIVVDTCRRLGGGILPNVHVLAHVRRALSARALPRPDPHLNTSGPVDDLVAACRAALARELTPAHVAGALAQECFDLVLDAFRRRVQGPIDLNDTRQRALLASEVQTATRRFGPLQTTSFLTLDEDALPHLIDDPALVAVDIRHGAASLRLAVPAVERVLLASGRGSERIAWHVVDDVLDYLEYGDPRLKERRPATPERLSRLLTGWSADSGPRPPLPELSPALRQRHVPRLLEQLPPSLAEQLPARWLFDEDPAGPAAAPPCPGSIRDWLQQLDPASLPDRTAGAVLRYLTLQADSAAAARRLLFLKPELASALSAAGPSTLATLWPLEGGPRRRQVGAVLNALEQALPFLSDRQAASFLETMVGDRAWCDPANLSLVAPMLEVLCRWAERGRLVWPLAGRLFEDDGPVARLVWAGFEQADLLSTLLPALERLHRAGAVRDGDLVDLFNTSRSEPPARQQLPFLLRAQSDTDGRGAGVFLRWLTSVGPGLLADEACRELTFPTLSSAQAAAWMLGLLADLFLDPFEQHLQVLELSVVSGQIDVDPIIRTWTDWRIRDTPGLSYLLTRQGSPIVQAMLAWSSHLLRRQRMPQDALHRLLQVGDSGPSSVLGLALRHDDVALTRAVAHLLEHAREQALVDPATLSIVLQTCLSLPQPAARHQDHRGDAWGVATRSATPPYTHALDVLLESLLRPVAAGALPVGLLVDWVWQAPTPEPGDQDAGPHWSPGLYVRLLRAMLRVAPPAAPGQDPARDRAPDWPLALWECRRVPEGPTAAEQALRDGASGVVGEVLRLGALAQEHGWLNAAHWTRWRQRLEDVPASPPA